METNQPSRSRIHPLIAGAAVSVMLASLVGIAAMTGVLPNSHANAAETTRVTAHAGLITPVPTLPAAQQLVAASAPVDYKQSSAGPLLAPAPQVAIAPAVRDEAPKHKPAVHHRHPVQHAQAQSGQQYSQASIYQQPPAPAPAPAAARYSPVGIGIGAVVGGLLGNQVGGGTGKTLATVAGAVGGGYVGNEIAKRNP
jgi:Glycine zipper 2TM domain